MNKFIVVPVVDKGGKKLENLRVNTSSIHSYRKWMTDNGNEQTVLFLKGTEERMLIADMPVELLDKLVDVKCLSVTV